MTPWVVVADRDSGATWICLNRTQGPNRPAGWYCGRCGKGYLGTRPKTGDVCTKLVTNPMILPRSRQHVKDRTYPVCRAVVISTPYLDASPRSR